MQWSVVAGWGALLFPNSHISGVFNDYDDVNICLHGWIEATHLCICPHNSRSGLIVVVCLKMCIC